MASPLTVVAAINSIEQGQLPQLHHICREMARHLTSALWFPIDIVPITINKQYLEKNYIYVIINLGIGNQF